jgi:hypothetical protein
MNRKEEEFFTRIFSLARICYHQQKMLSLKCAWHFSFKYWMTLRWIQFTYKMCMCTCSYVCVSIGTIRYLPYTNAKIPSRLIQLSITVHEQAKSNRPCNIFNFVVLCVLYVFILRPKLSIFEDKMISLCDWKSNKAMLDVEKIEKKRNHLRTSKTTKLKMLHAMFDWGLWHTNQQLYFVLSIYLFVWSNCETLLLFSLD